MVQVHVTPRGGECYSVLCEHLRLGPEYWPGGTTPRNPPVPGFARRHGGTAVGGLLSSLLASPLIPVTLLLALAVIREIPLYMAVPARRGGVGWVWAW